MSAAAIDFDALPVAAKAQVVVVGGGPGGLGAAIAAAEEGADTLLVERYAFLGGMATAGMVNPFMPWHAGGTPIIRGVFERMIRRLGEMGGMGGPRYKACFDFELLKLLADDMVIEAGARMRLHTSLVAVDAADGRVKRIAVASKSGLEVIEGDLFIDSTGDGDLCTWSGCDVRKGRDEDGLAQPMTLNFRMGGVDLDRLPAREEINEFYDAAKDRGEIDNPRENVLWFYTTRDGELHFNTTRVVMHDGTDADALTEAELIGRRQVVQMVSFLKTYIPGMEDAFLLSMGAQIGIRETRRVMADHILTTDEVLAATKFDDGIARGSYSVDIHSPVGTGTVILHLPPGEAYDIPYRCITPLGFDNLLVAARCISADHGAHSSQRVMPIVMAIGEGAGVAAAQAVAAGVDTRSVDIVALRERLLERGASLSDGPTST